MMLRRLREAPAAHSALLWTASWLVPDRGRAEWLAEWRAELWHIAHERQLFHIPNPEAEAPTDDAFTFCLGAFEDAFWLRRNTRRPHRWYQCNSPLSCSALLLLVAVVAWVLAVKLPGARAALGREPYRGGNSIVQIVNEGVLSTSTPTISLSDYESWRQRSQHIFSDFAFFTPALWTHVRDPRNLTSFLYVSHASDNLFDLMKVEIDAPMLELARAQNSPALVLTRTAWRRYFSADPNLVGKTLDIDGRQTLVAAIVSDDTWRLPMTIHAWLLETDHNLRYHDRAKGFVLGKEVSHPPSLEMLSGRWHLDVPRADQSLSSILKWGDDYDGYDCVSLARYIDQPSAIFFCMLLLALVTLPATTALSLGEYPVTSEPITASRRWLRWAFLAFKFAVTLPIVYFGALDIAYLPPWLPISPEYVQLLLSFLGCLLLFRWALRDQRQRCPVCLRLLTNPARIGEYSRSFLAWCGTETICNQGHGLLHTPEVSTTWFTTQRWLDLDSSWKPLFEDAFTGTLT